MSLYRLRQVDALQGEFTMRIGACDLEPGAIYAVVGPNGSGKTLLLNMLAFLHPPSGGEIWFDGAPVDYGNPQELLRLRRNVACLMQNPYLFNMSVRDNISYGLRVRGVPKPELRSRVEAMMDRLSLSHLAGRNARRLSGGEAQRVALARTLVLDGAVLLLDEPTANVDQHNLGVVEEVIRRQNRERHVTVVLTTHSRDQACRLSRDLITLMDGRITDVLYENVLAGLLVREPDAQRVVMLEHGIRICVGSGREGRATVVIDPREVILSPQPLVSSALNTLRGRITKIEEAHDALRVFVDAEVTICAVITRRSFVELRLNIASEVWLTFKASAVQVIQ